MPTLRCATFACCLLLAAAVVSPVRAQGTAPTPAAQEPVVKPEVARRDVRPPRYPSRDFEMGLFYGTYATENFGASAVSGLRLGYHVTEDIFVHLQLAQTKVSDEAFRAVLPGGVFVNQKETLSYASLSFGWNVLPGEVFFGRDTAKLSQGYVLAGVGTTDFAGQRRQTWHAGFGLRLLLSERVALQADVRDHVFQLDLLGRRQTTQNIEVSAGLSVHF